MVGDHVLVFNVDMLQNYTGIYKVPTRYACKFAVSHLLASQLHANPIPLE